MFRGARITPDTRFNMVLDGKAFLHDERIIMSTLFKTDPKTHVHIMGIATRMKHARLSNQFISDAAKLAQEYEGAYDLMVLWDQEVKGRSEIVADLQEEIDSHEEQHRRMVEKPSVSFDDLDAIGRDVMAYKRSLRLEVDKHGGISELARLTGIPQPSLSRFFTSASMPGWRRHRGMGLWQRWRISLQ